MSRALTPAEQDHYADHCAECAEVGIPAKPVADWLVYVGAEPANLFEQLPQVTRNMVAMAIGAEGTNPGFRITLREIPPLPVGFTIGDAVRAYCSYIIAQLDKLSADVSQ